VVRAVSLLSGGLDSLLATKLILSQNIEVEAVTFNIPFMSSKSAIGVSARACQRFRIKHHIIDLAKSSEYLEVIKNPSFGYGKNLNPCIDCHIFMLKEAKKLMRKIGADFVFTGEVLGERPMSQRKDALNLISKESTLKGLLLRPLSAKLLEQTTLELKGQVDRDKLLDIRGRSRKRQFDLAREMGITEYLSVAGGCLLTDKEYCKKLKDLIDHNQLNIDNIQLLKVGRHFRFNQDQKLVVGRNKDENEDLVRLKIGNCLLLEAQDIPSPTAVLRPKKKREDSIKLAASIVAHYTKAEDEIKIKFYTRQKCLKVLKTLPAEREIIERYRI
jgi:tRNA-uridine 2-sulfurtransferase